MTITQRFQRWLAIKDVKELERRLNRIEFEVLYKNFEIKNLGNERTELTERLVNFKKILQKIETKDLLH